MKTFLLYFISNENVIFPNRFFSISFWNGYNAGFSQARQTSKRDSFAIDVTYFGELG